MVESTVDGPVAFLALGRDAAAAAAERLGEAGTHGGAPPVRPHVPHLAPPATCAAVFAV